MTRLLISILFSILFAVGSAAEPKITGITPRAVAPGKRTLLTFSGSDLDQATNFWATFAAEARCLTNSGRMARFEVSCPALPPGVHAVQVSGPDGVSSTELILLDSMRATQVAPKHSRSGAISVQIPSAIDGSVSAEQIDYYRFHAQSGQRLSIEVIANRIGSQMDPVVEVQNADGSEITSCDDEPDVWRDARFAFIAPLTADYTLAVHDVGFAGGPAYFYRLRISEQPLVWYTFPLQQPGEKLNPTTEAGVSPENSESDGSPANPLLETGMPTTAALAEREPNETLADAQSIACPITVHGKINGANDVDFYKIEITKPAKLIFESRTRSLGSPADLILLLKNPADEVIAQSNSALPSEASLTNDFKEPGPYILQVRELSGTGPAGAPYRIEFYPFKPSVAASTETDQIQIAPGASTSLKITVNRFDYNGEIRLEPATPVEGLKIENGIIPEKKNETELKFHFSDLVKPGALFHLKLLAKIGEAGSSSLVSTAPALRKAFPLMPILPPELDGLISVAIRKP